ncbi:MAG: winged helix-turn-helix transcriptional regulator [Duncaniella sp.]|nr:winged helix-turn-helix transcriptional regulator [Duncaniella sp.]
MLKVRSRFSEILDFCPGLTDKVLTRRLKGLTDNKMICKGADGYEMTVHGIWLVPIFASQALRDNEPEGSHPSYHNKSPPAASFNVVELGTCSLYSKYRSIN